MSDGLGNWRTNTNHRRPGRRQRPASAVAQAPVAAFRLLSDIVPAIVAAPVRAAEIALLWLNRHRQRRVLDGLSDHMLKDLGVSRAEVDREISKPFWRG